MLSLNEVPSKKTAAVLRCTPPPLPLRPLLFARALMEVSAAEEWWAVAGDRVGFAFATASASSSSRTAAPISGVPATYKKPRARWSLS